MKRFIFFLLIIVCLSSFVTAHTYNYFLPPNQTAHYGELADWIDPDNLYDTNWSSFAVHNQGVGFLQTYDFNWTGVLNCSQLDEMAELINFKTDVGEYNYSVPEGCRCTTLQFKEVISRTAGGYPHNLSCYSYNTSTWITVWNDTNTGGTGYFYEAQLLQVFYDFQYYPIMSDFAEHSNYNRSDGSNILQPVTMTDFGGREDRFILSVYADANASNGFLVFRNEETLQIVDDRTIYVEVYGDYEGFAYTTTTGYLTVPLNSEGLFRVVYDADGYMLTTSFINVSYFEDLEKTLYLLNSSIGTNITVTVIDEIRTPVERAYLKVLKRVEGTNNFIETQVVETNFDGEAIINAILVSPLYQFILEYPYGTVKTITLNQTQLFQDTIQFQISNQKEIATEFFSSLDITQSLEFDSGTNSFDFIWSDGQDRYICMKVYRLSMFGDELYNSSCETSASGIISLGVLNLSDSSYNAKVYLDSDILINSLSHTFNKVTSGGKFGLYLIALITVIFMFVTIWDRAVGLIITPLPVIFGTVIGVIDVDKPLAFGMVLVYVVIAVIISRK